jgi:hypothetical protein
MSTEAHFFVTITLETHHETQFSFHHYLIVLSYAIIFKDFCTEGHKSSNNLHKKIWLSKKIGYQRWPNILLEGYQVLMKKGWKGLVGHPYERERHNIFFLFYFPHFIFESCYFLSFYYILFCF